MSPRERTIATVVLTAVLVAAGLFLFHQLYLEPLHAREETVVKARQDFAKQDEQLKQAIEQAKQLAQWRKLSLPVNSDPLFCQREYGKLLRSLITTSGFATSELDVKPVGTTSVVKPTLMSPNETFYTPVNFTVSGHADLPRLVNLLRQFYSQPILHKIKSFKISRPKSATPRTGELEVELNIEALIVNDAESRSTLLPSEKVNPRVLADPTRDYSAIAAKDIFYAPVPRQKVQDGPDPAASVKLTSIHLDKEGRQVVTLYDESTKATWSLYPGQGPDTFQLKKRDELRVEGTVVAIKDEDAIFRAGERYYRLHLGHSVEEALRRPLSAVEVNTLHLPPARENTSSRLEARGNDHLQ